MKVDRRDLIKLAGGTAFGVLFTPVPWKLLDDSAIWTQNWPWLPQPLRGEIKTKFTNCTLCQAGCGVRIRTVGEQPVALSGVAGHPGSRGALCPVGLGGHHLAFHPGRIRQALDHGKPAATEAAVKALAETIPATKAPESIAILDGRPGRSVSVAYRQFLAQFPNGVYLRPFNRESGTLEALAELAGQSGTAYGIDLENTRTLLSFGAPVLDGWSAPGRWAQARTHLKLIQAEPRQSRTAQAADLWLPIKPGAEAALAFGLANVILERKLYPASVRRGASDFEQFAAAVARYTPEFVGGIAGVPPQSIVEAAMAFASNGPAVAIGGGNPAAGPLGSEAEYAIAALNLLAGSVGVAGGIVARRGWSVEKNVKPAADIASVPDRSIRVLIIDDIPAGQMTPWPLVERKLVPDALVVSLSAFPSAATRHAGYVVPAPSYLEAADDLPVAFDASAATFAISTPAYPAPEGALEPAAFLAKIAGEAGLKPPGDIVEIRKSRAEAIRKSGQGALFAYSGETPKAVKETKSADEFWKALCDGACWVDTPAPAKPPARFALLGKGKAPGEGSVQSKGEFPLALIPCAWLGGAVQGSPLMTKLYQESGLREAANSIRVHPDTAASAGVKDGSVAVVETASGTTTGRVTVNPAVMPGVLEVTAAAGIAGVLDICKIESDGTWRATGARIRRA